MRGVVISQPVGQPASRWSHNINSYVFFSSLVSSLIFQLSNLELSHDDVRVWCHWVHENILQTKFAFDITKHKSKMWFHSIESTLPFVRFHRIHFYRTVFAIRFKQLQLIVSKLKRGAKSKKAQNLSKWDRHDERNENDDFVPKMRNSQSSPSKLGIDEIRTENKTNALNAHQPTRKNQMNNNIQCEATIEFDSYIRRRKNY